MTKEEFLNLGWDDSHVGYDIEVEKYRHIAYMTFSSAYSETLFLVADDKRFPIMNSGCGIHQNLCPADIIELLNKREPIKKIATVIDGKVYDLKSDIMHVNGIDGEVLFETIPFKPLTKEENNELDEIDIDIEER